MDLEPFECETPKPLAEINIIPLVDVMLVLLILFMITAPLLVPQSIPLELPRVNSEMASLPPVQIRLSIDQHGDLFWNDEAILQAELPTRLQKLDQQRAQIQLYADKQTTYQRLAEIMHLLQQAGVSQLDFVTQAE